MMTLEQILFSQGFGTRKICRALITERKVKINKSICDDINSKWDINGYDNDPTGFTFQYMTFYGLIRKTPTSC